MISKIQKRIQGNQYEYSKHAVDESIRRHISDTEMKEAIQSGEVMALLHKYLQRQNYP